jgi:hypothetical protein
MKKILIIFLFALILIPSSSVAELGFTDGNKILSSCNELIKIIDSQLELDSFEAGRCWGYISASTDIYKVMKYGSSGIVCLPEGLEVSQLVRVIIEYLNEHPKDLNRPAFMLITNALAETFPCPQTQLLPQSPK